MEPILAHDALDHHVIAVVVVGLATPAIQAIKIVVVSILSVLIDNGLVQLTLCGV